MTDAGFFRGTSSDQDNRFANKQKKLLKELNFSPILNTKLTMSKIDVDSLKPWIDQKIKDVLEKDDDLLSGAIYEHLAEKEPDGKNILVLITGFVDDSKASKFMEELWTKLIDLQDNSNGVSKLVNDNRDIEPESKENPSEEATKSDKLTESNNDSNDALKKDSEDERRSSGSSHSATPPSRSVSKSPGHHKLDERSRGRPRKRLQDEVSRDGSNPPNGPPSPCAPHEGSRPTRSRSRSGSRSRSPSASRQSPEKAGRSPRRSRSSSRSKRSGSRSFSGSGSRSRSRSRSRSKSKSRSGSSSRSRSPRRGSRSPYNSYRGRRSRSRSRGYRPRSRSPRGRRGYIGGRGSYRGSFGAGFHDRRRGGIGLMRDRERRRPSPWNRGRRYSPRSPPRRRRSPSFSPRRRRSPSPYHRRPSHSRSPPIHMMRSPPRPRNMSGVGHLDMLGSRHVPHHDMHRPMMPMARSPRRPMDHRGPYIDGPMLPRHSPGPSLIKPPDLPSTSHGLLPLGPSGTGPYSPPSSSRKKHKKDKKHRKHKKSKKHRSASPEKKKKHKKHSKKSKKHKSH